MEVLLWLIRSVPLASAAVLARTHVPWVLSLRAMIVTSSMPVPAWTAVLAAIPAPMALSALLNNYIARTKNTGAFAPVFFCRLAPGALPVVQYYQ